ncbi:MAG: hypothetical protein HC913_01475 [Microscillaceae bacterium]|nr:hypothetical protein [Microscillaceae bacterium]
MKKLNYLFLTLALPFVMVACSDDDPSGTTSVTFENTSVTPAMVKAGPGAPSGMQIFSMFSSEDTDFLPYRFGGSADGAGMIPNGDGTFTLLVNHEDNFAVSRLTLDRNMKPVNGEYILNSTGGKWRLCSATMATPEEHGFGPMFLTCGESGVESRTHALDPFAAPGLSSISREVAGLGRWNAENAVPLSKDAYPGKTVVVIGDDDSGNTGGGNVAMYISNVVGDLNSGDLYFLRRTDLNSVENDITLNNTYNVEFVLIPNHASRTGADINAFVEANNGIEFNRVEDVDYRRGSAANNRELYFTVTGNDENNDTRTLYGRVYRLKLDANNPLVGTIEVILDGDVRPGVADKFQNPDNICVTENYVYVQEDANSYGDETHDAYVYQYNIATKEVKVVLELDHFRNNTALATTYGTNAAAGGDDRFGRWEYGAMLDISDMVGSENTFIICLQPHTWRKNEFRNPDGGTIRVSENQGSQLVIVKGLPR